jgi:hypothetical protein
MITGAVHSCAVAENTETTARNAPIGVDRNSNPTSSGDRKRKPASFLSFFKKHLLMRCDVDDAREAGDGFKLSTVDLRMGVLDWRV